MKLSTQLYITGRAGRWVAMAGTAIAVIGLIAKGFGASESVAHAVMGVGAVLAVFGIAYHLVAGDESEIPANLVDLIDAAHAESKRVDRE